MAPRGVPGIPVAIVATGGILVWSGIYNQSLTSSLGSILQGKQPAPGPQVQAKITLASDTSAGESVTSTGGQSAGIDTANQSLGKLMAAAYGWSTGEEWTALNNLITKESGWSDTTRNSSSGAAGIGQKISGFDSTYQEGNASQQIAWTLNYIKGRYGDPIAAWQHEQSQGWY